MVISLISLVGLNGCKKDFLDPQPYGRYTPEQLQSTKGIEGVLTGAYGMLDGQGIAGASGWMVGATNWVYGDVVSDDAYKGTDAGDQPQMTEIELWASQPANTYFYYKWLSIYEGVARANDVIRLAGVIEVLPAAAKTDYIAQARFLRAHFHFDAKRVFNKVPYISDTTTSYTNTVLSGRRSKQISNLLMITFPKPRRLLVKQINGQQVLSRKNIYVPE